MRRPRRLVLSAAALGLALTASGCAYFNPVQTHDFYEAADGTNANIKQSGALFAGMRNALFVVEDDGTPAFSGTAVNYSGQDITIELEASAGDAAIFSTSVAVPAHETVQLGPEEGQQLVPIEELPVEPGAVVELDVTADGQTTVISVPVLETSLDHFGEPAQG